MDYIKSPRTSERHGKDLPQKTTQPGVVYTWNPVFREQEQESQKFRIRHMAQWVRALAFKPKDLGSIPDVSLVEGEN